MMVRMGPSPMLSIITACNSSCRKVMFSQVSVSHSVHRGVDIYDLM